MGTAGLLLWNLRRVFPSIRLAWPTAATPGSWLRAVIDNRDFEAYWAFHVRREHDRVHQAPCQDGYHLIA